MSGEAILISQILAGVIQIFVLRMKAAGMTAEEVEKAIAEARSKVLASKPEFLPDV